MHNTLLLDVRKKSHEPCPLHGFFDGSLLLCGKAGFTAIHHAAMRIDKIFQEVDIFVVDMLDIILRKNVVRHRDSC